MSAAARSAPGAAPVRRAAPTMPAASTRRADPTTFAADGVFAGYASLFGVVDLTGDVVLSGAFRASLARRGPGGVKMLYQHDPAAPIGRWLEIAEDSRGLAVVGELHLGLPRAREVAALLAAGIVDGLSIGFRTVKARSDRRTGVRHVAEIDLWEISLVTFPMLPAARVTRLGAADDPAARLVRDLAAAAGTLRP